MKIIKIQNGTIHLVNERGIAIAATFGKDIISAFYNDKQDLIVAMFKTGKVELLNEHGLVNRVVINSGALNARFVGEEILIETIKGKTEIRSQMGLLKKTI